MKYAFGQVLLNPSLAKHCNFAIVGGKASGIYRFLTGFYGLTVMPTEFQRIMEEILINIANVYVFIDDILKVTKGTKEEHEEKVREVFRKLDSRKLQLKKKINAKLQRTRLNGSDLTYQKREWNHIMRKYRVYPEKWNRKT